MDSLAPRPLYPREAIFRHSYYNERLCGPEGRPCTLCLTGESSYDSSASHTIVYPRCRLYCTIAAACYLCCEHYDAVDCTVPAACYLCCEHYDAVDCTIPAACYLCCEHYDAVDCTIAAACYLCCEHYDRHNFVIISLEAVQSAGRLIEN
jgi:hypothetical protein